MSQVTMSFSTWPLKTTVFIYVIILSSCLGQELFRACEHDYCYERSIDRRSSGPKDLRERYRLRNEILQRDEETQHKIDQNRIDVRNMEININNRREVLENQQNHRLHKETTGIIRARVEHQAKSDVTIRDVSEEQRDILRRFNEHDDVNRENLSRNDITLKRIYSRDIQKTSQNNRNKNLKILNRSNIRSERNFGVRSKEDRYDRHEQRAKEVTTSHLKYVRKDRRYDDVNRSSQRKIERESNHNDEEHKRENNFSRRLENRREKHLKRFNYPETIVIRRFYKEVRSEINRREEVEVPIALRRLVDRQAERNAIRRFQDKRDDTSRHFDNQENISRNLENERNLKKPQDILRQLENYESVSIVPIKERKSSEQEHLKIQNKIETRLHELADRMDSRRLEDKQEAVRGERSYTLRRIDERKVHQFVRRSENIHGKPLESLTRDDQRDFNRRLNGNRYSTRIDEFRSQMDRESVKHRNEIIREQVERRLNLRSEVERNKILETAVRVSRKLDERRFSQRSDDFRHTRLMHAEDSQKEREPLQRRSENKLKGYETLDRLHDRYAQHDTTRHIDNIRESVRSDNRLVDDTQYSRRSDQRLNRAEHKFILNQKNNVDDFYDNHYTDEDYIEKANYFLKKSYMSFGQGAILAYIIVKTINGNNDFKNRLPIILRQAVGMIGF